MIKLRRFHDPEGLRFGHSTRTSAEIASIRKVSEMRNTHVRNSTARTLQNRFLIEFQAMIV